MTAEINYSINQGGAVHHYRLIERQLTYWCDASEIEFRLDLRESQHAVTRRRSFHRLWYVGWLGVAAPLFTFGMIYVTEGVIAVEGTGWIHLGFFVAGTVLLILYRRPTMVYEVSTGRGDRLWIFIDPAQPGSAERLAEALRN